MSPALGPCWVWGGRAFDKDGYGIFNPGIDRREQRAHRWSWLFAHGHANNNVLHRCDNPPCVRPDHLFLGTNADNTADKVAKGRQTRGERVPRAKLTAADVLEIRRRHAVGDVTWRQLAEEYGLQRATSIHGIITRRTWKHI